MCALSVGASCLFVSRAEAPREPSSQGDAVTIFLSGHELGAMKPCGCSGKQLGGLDRRGAIFSTVPRENRLIVDTGLLVEGDSEQDLIKFDIILQAFNLLGYDLVHLADRDVEIARNKALLGGLSSLFNVITACEPADVNVPAKYTRQFLLNKGETVAVAILAVDPQATPVDQIPALLPPRSGAKTVSIVILSQSDPAVIEAIADSVRGVDCLICPSDSDEPKAVARRENKLLVLSVGRLGKYITRLRICPEPAARAATEAQQSEIPEAFSTTHSGLGLSFSAVPVTEDLRPQSSQVQLYQAYQLLLKDSNLLQTLPRFTLPDDLQYMGSQSCAVCHDEVHKRWRATRHADAYATLERVGSQYDPECIACHVIGLQYKSGFVSAELTPAMKDVGCENCHGPASKHVATAGDAGPGQPRSACLDCHTPEHSTDYAANVARYRQKIIHWKEQSASGSVK